MPLLLLSFSLKVIPGFIKYVNKPVTTLNINENVTINLNTIFLITKNSSININNEKINMHRNVDKKVLSEKLDKLDLLTF